MTTLICDNKIIIIFILLVYVTFFVCFFFWFTLQLTIVLLSQHVSK
jgi:hypothetical protein